MAELDRDNPLYDYIPANPSVATTVTTTDSAAPRRWTKAGVVETDDGPVDVDARGKAADGSTPIPATELVTPLVTPLVKKVVAPVKAKLQSTYTDPDTGDIIDVYDDGTEKIRKKGTLALDREKAKKDALEEKRLAGKSAYDILYAEFDRYGLGSLVADVEGFIKDGLSEAEFTIKLRNTPAYQTRFAANKKRIDNGFTAIDEATYLGLEDKFQSIMQNYGMPEKYYARANKLGVQQYFEDAISKNIDPVTFEERIIEGKKVIDANKTTLDAIKRFYPSLNDGDFLSYVLDSKNAISDIQRKVTSAEIGGAQLGAGLGATFAGAEALAKAGITGKGYQQAASTIAQAALRGGQLASIYGEDPYTQQTAEEFVLDIPGSTDALKKTQKISGLEKATFGGQSGLTSGALSRDRAGAY
jgi:hypothetical protein